MLLLRRQGAAQFDAAFGAQHRQMEMRDIAGADGRMRIRVNVAESPIVMLGRKKDKDGKPYLAADLIRVAERLREDFELAQMGPRVAQNWDRFLPGGDWGGFQSDSGGAEGPRAARDRVALALRDLGPGLGDVALRVCCFLEGIEAAERRMGDAFNHPANNRVDSGIKKYTINGVRHAVLINTRGNKLMSASNGPRTKLNNSDTGKNASQIATLCFQRGGCRWALPNQASRPTARFSCGWANRPAPRCSQAWREAECSQEAMVCSSLKRKTIWNSSSPAGGASCGQSPGTGPRCCASG